MIHHPLSPYPMERGYIPTILLLLNMTDTELDENMIAPCGLYCGDCFAHQGKIADLARDLRKELRSAKFERYAEEMSKLSWFEAFGKYADCYECMGAMVKFRCKKGCRNGGGNPYCKMKSCPEKKGYEGCWECDSFEDCKHLDFLNPTHMDAHRKNLRRLNKKGKEGFLKGKRDW